MFSLRRIMLGMKLRLCAKTPLVVGKVGNTLHIMNAIALSLVQFHTLNCTL